MDVLKKQDQSKQQPVFYDRQFRDRPGSCLTDKSLTKQKAITSAMELLNDHVDALERLVGDIEGRERREEKKERVQDESLANLLDALPYRLVATGNVIDAVLMKLEKHLFVRGSNVPEKAKETDELGAPF